MSHTLILLTSATGLIGFRILVLCLHHAHRVRVALRTLTSSIKSLSTTNSTLTTTHLTFTDIANLTPPPLRLKYRPTRHPASIGQNLEAHYIHPTIKTCLDLLSSARAQCSVKRIILTSSLAALIDRAEDTEDTVHAATTRAVNVQAPALKTVEDWARREKPVFDVVHLALGHVFGVKELVDDPRELLVAGSNRIILSTSGSRFESSLQTQTQTAPAPAPEPGVTVHLDDVAEAHVRALNPFIPGNRLYILSSGGEVDAQESAKTLGMEFRGIEEQVRDVVAYYLSCLERRGGDCTVGIGG
ncbi:hypothetical protein BO83DRAFT_398674 [Aspergillus eucalypticola CBS 122712]|uniref:NAD(P)-binding protein n=1 Tax=Aspergillus eucalypticola (strain CBS 122712 / IBT 29274) TaxID=1448314 RepID=A0A317VN33_ASPEC|nr:uncharacterized protein BO83DRAFT_398674 [Aspergillus eucalypticola CBS 122712]PWY74262.1 hypothetical protein BO83DRAFT_398674 [Aspergillus eucalypticola CBS 122712]